MMEIDTENEIVQPNQVTLTPSVTPMESRIAEVQSPRPTYKDFEPPYFSSGQEVMEAATSENKIMQPISTAANETRMEIATLETGPEPPSSVMFPQLDVNLDDIWTSSQQLEMRIIQEKNIDAELRDPFLGKFSINVTI